MVHTFPLFMCVCVISSTSLDLIATKIDQKSTLKGWKQLLLKNNGINSIYAFLCLAIVTCKEILKHRMCVSFYEIENKKAQYTVKNKRYIVNVILKSLMKYLKKLPWI